jgi:hypothetical protein
MEYQKEYQEFIKKVTDTFVDRLTHDASMPIEEYYIPRYKKLSNEIIFDVSIGENGSIFHVHDEAPQEISGVIKRLREVVKAWLTIENECT